MTELKPIQMLNLLPLFSGKKVYHIARSCCLGLVPCRAFADDTERPTAAVLSLSQLGICYVAGNAEQAPALLEALRDWHPWYEINDPPADWYPALAAWTRAGHATVRYEFANDPKSFDKDALQKLATPPEGFEIRPYTREMLESANKASWSEDQMGTFLTPDDFVRDGLGIALLKDGELIAGCSSFCRHEDGYEIQVDTHPDHRGHGYATCICAAFILACLSRGMTPYWDAANFKSMRLAEKIGFVFERAYPAWILITSKTTQAEVAAQVIG